MTSRPKYFISVVSAFLAAAFVAGAAPGYLAVIGPAPLRFQPPPPSPFHTPAPKPVAPAPPAPASTNSTPAPSAGNTIQSNAPSATTNEFEVFTPPSSQDVISPQMLLKYFNHGTNGTGSEIIAPMNLQLPTQNAPLPSKATYSN